PAPQGVLPVARRRRRKHVVIVSVCTHARRHIVNTGQHHKVPVPLVKLERNRRLHAPHILRYPSRRR
ncbi:hypothetical protein B0H10DRAFT_2135403, partial [Mycena sp. CBHHK59/15]